MTASSDTHPAVVSFEFFPPNTEVGERNLVRTAHALAPLGPSFVSVTYGAGGSSRDRTQLAVSQLASETSLDVAGHLTCVGATKAEVATVIDDYLKVGVNHIVALRGDPPEGTPANVPGGYQDAAELVAGIRAHVEAEGLTDFQISVGAYPEVHPRAASAQADLDSLKAKLDAGADRALTQFFFEPEMFLRFRDDAAKAGIDDAIVPGIMPVANFGGICRFSDRAGATVPTWMHERFAGLDENPAVRDLVAASTASELCRRLQAEGIDEFHFYTMNRPDLTIAVCRTLGVAPLGAELAPQGDPA